MSIDNVNRPKHYTSDPSGVECITIARHRTFNIGNAMKYLWRQGLKVAEGRPVESQGDDLNKALYYVFDEMHRLGVAVTCRHPRMVEAVISDMATKINPEPGPNVVPLAASTLLGKTPAAGEAMDGAPRWVRIQDTVDDEDVVCRTCRCPWWVCQSERPITMQCAKCGSERVRFRGGSFKIVARETDKPEL